MAGMKPQDVYELTGAADPRVSPDGSTVAYAVWWIDAGAAEYRSAIWLAATDGSSPPRQLTSGEKRDAAPRWSPDGTLLAFVSNRHGDHLQLHVIPASGPGEPRRLTDLEEDVEHAEWSPDGTRLVFVSRVPDASAQEKEEAKRGPRRITRLQYKLDNVGWTTDRPSHLFVVEVAGSGRPRQLTFGEAEDAMPAWSPDGETVAFVSARHEDWDLTTIRDVYAVDANGGEPERLTAMDGACASPAWSPDGSRIAYQFVPGVFDEPRHGQIAALDVKSRERTVLTEALDRTCSPYPPLRSPLWDGESLVFSIEDGGNMHLLTMPADGAAAPEVLVGGEQLALEYDLRPGVLVHAATTSTTLTELYRGERRLTEVGRTFTSARELSPPERFTALAPDGAEVDAWIVRPAGFEEGTRYPLVLNIHGGPYTQYGTGFFDESQVYAGAGYAVAYCNPRGSSGYGEAWARAIRGPVDEGPGWGSVDFDDVMAVADAVAKFDFVDPDRMAVMGGSYGGYLTSWIVGHTDRFRCAVSERAVNDMLSEDLMSDIAGFFKGYVGAYGWDAPEVYAKLSPATYARDITTPLLILHSENDLRCPLGQGEGLFTILRSMKREVEMVCFPAESHELSRSGSPSHRVMRFEVILDWLERHLSG